MYPGGSRSSRSGRSCGKSSSSKMSSSCCAPSMGCVRGPQGPVGPAGPPGPNLIPDFISCSAVTACDGRPLYVLEPSNPASPRDISIDVGDGGGAFMLTLGCPATEAPCHGSFSVDLQLNNEGNAANTTLGTGGFLAGTQGSSTTTNSLYSSVISSEESSVGGSIAPNTTFSSIISSTTATIGGGVTNGAVISSANFGPGTSSIQSGESILRAAVLASDSTSSTISLLTGADLSVIDTTISGASGTGNPSTGIFGTAGSVSNSSVVNSSITAGGGAINSSPYLAVGSTATVQGCSVENSSLAGGFGIVPDLFRTGTLTVTDVKIDTSSFSSPSNYSVGLVPSAITGIGTVEQISIESSSAISNSDIIAITGGTVEQTSISSSSAINASDIIAISGGTVEQTSISSSSTNSGDIISITGGTVEQTSISSSSASSSDIIAISGGTVEQTSISSTTTSGPANRILLNSGTATDVQIGSSAASRNFVNNNGTLSEFSVDSSSAIGSDPINMLNVGTGSIIQQSSISSTTADDGTLVLTTTGASMVAANDTTIQNSSVIATHDSTIVAGTTSSAPITSVQLIPDLHTGQSPTSGISGSAILGGFQNLILNTSHAATIGGDGLLIVPSGSTYTPTYSTAASTGTDTVAVGKYNNPYVQYTLPATTIAGTNRFATIAGSNVNGSPLTTVNNYSLVINITLTSPAGYTVTGTITNTGTSTLTVTDPSSQIVGFIAVTPGTVTGTFTQATRSYNVDSGTVTISGSLPLSTSKPTTATVLNAVFTGGGGISSDANITGSIIVTATTGDAGQQLFVVGNGTGDLTRSNAFVVTEFGVFTPSGVISGNADYAEMFESLDGTRIPIGTVVAMDGATGKIRPAKTGDKLLGVISNTPSHIGGAAHDHWEHKYLLDEDGNKIHELVEETSLVVDHEAWNKLVATKRQQIIDSLKVEEKEKVESKTEPKVEEKVEKVEEKVEKVKEKVEKVEEKVEKVEEKVEKVKEKVKDTPFPEKEFGEMLEKMDKPMKKMTKSVMRAKINPEFDATKPYTPRLHRPEWNIVGLLGKVKILNGQPLDSKWKKIKPFNKKHTWYLIH